MTNTKNKKFSELIGELTETWLLWMKHNTITKDDSISFSDRRKSAEECEKLINNEYVVVEQLDNFFKDE